MVCVWVVAKKPPRETAREAHLGFGPISLSQGHPPCPDGHTPATATRWGGDLRLFFRARSARRRKHQRRAFFVATSSKIYGRKQRKSRESERTGVPSVVEMPNLRLGSASRTPCRPLACVALPE